MRVSADPDACVGAGQCVLSAPDVFGQDPESGVVVVLEHEPDPSSTEGVRDAEHLCPVRAIYVEQK